METISKKIRVDVVAVPFSGHLYPLIELIEPLLQDEDYIVRVFTGPAKVALLESKEIECIPIMPENPRVMEQIANTDSPVKSNGFSMLRQLKQNLKIIPEIMTQLEVEMREHQTDIVIADFIAVPAGIAANRIGIPWITTNPSPFTIETKTGIPSYLGGLQPSTTPYGKIRDILGRQIVHSFKQLAVWLFRNELSTLDFSLYNEKKEETIYSPYSILGLGMTEVEFNQDFPEQFKFAGPVPASPEHSENLVFPVSNFKKRIFVTMGTHLKWIKELLVERVLMLAELYPHYLFIISEGESDRIEELPERVSENLWIYPYVPYSSYLSLFDLVIHHGGAGIFYQCIQHGKPAIIMPQDYDQFDYAARGETAKISYTVKKNNQKILRQKFDEAIEKKDWPELEQLQKAFFAYEPKKVLKEEVDRLINRTN